MSGGLVIQVLVSGLAAGSVYGLIALGYTLIWRMTGVLNFAHGDLVSTGTFGFLLAVGGGGAVAVVGRGEPALLVGAAVAVAATVAAALLVERLAVRPFLGLGLAGGWIAATAALGLLLRSLAGLGFQAESYSVPDVLPPARRLDLPGGGGLDLRSVAVLAVALGMALAFDRWLALSRTGLAMRAAADAPEAAGLVGVPVRRLQGIAWGLAGAMSAVAALLVAPGRPVTLTLGVILGLKGTAAAVLGGLGGARRAVVAGLALGVLEAIVTTLWLPAIDVGGLRLPQLGPLPGLQDLLALLLLVVALAALPRWIGGREERLE